MTFKMNTGKLIVFVLVVGMVYMFLDSLMPDGPFKVVLEGLSLIGICVYAAFVGRQIFKRRKRLDAANVKVECVRSTRVEALSEVDVTFLKRQMTRKMAAAMFLFLFIFTIYLVVTNFMLPVLFGSMGESLFYIQAGVIFFVAVYFFGKRIRRLRQEILDGKKLVVIGNVSRWTHYLYNEDDYVLYVDEIAFRVKPAVFDKYLIGDAIEAHLFEPWKNTLLFERKIEK